METTIANAFNIVGIAVRTTNGDGQSGIDIPQLWNRFLSEGISSQIPGKISDTVYAVYTDYEGDYTKPYTTILGCKVESLANIPAGFTGKTISSGQYLVFPAKGKIADGIVFSAWTKIWNTNYPRAYTADFEVYDERAADPNNATVDIYLAVK